MIEIDESRVGRLKYMSPRVLGVIPIRLVSFLETQSHPTDGICGEFDNLENEGNWDSDGF